jgi:hypothetical protein
VWQVGQSAAASYLITRQASNSSVIVRHIE